MRIEHIHGKIYSSNTATPVYYCTVHALENTANKPNPHIEPLIPSNEQLVRQSLVASALLLTRTIRVSNPQKAWAIIPGAWFFISHGSLRHNQTSVCNASSPGAKQRMKREAPQCKVGPNRQIGDCACFPSLRYCARLCCCQQYQPIPYPQRLQQDKLLHRALR